MGWICLIRWHLSAPATSDGPYDVPALAKDVLPDSDAYVTLRRHPVPHHGRRRVFGT